MARDTKTLEPGYYAECCLKWAVWLALLTIVLAAFQGCADKDFRLEPAPQGFTNDPQHGALRPKRATAQDLIDAANTGVVPDWFNDAERKAVERIKE